MVNNYAGGIRGYSAPTYDPNKPDRNLVTAYFYNNLGQQIATVYNYYDEDPSDGLTEADIESGVANKLNLVTRVFYGRDGRVSDTVTNFVGDISSDSVPDLNPSFPDRNLITHIEYDRLGRVTRTGIDRGAAGHGTLQTVYDTLGRVETQMTSFHNTNAGL